MSVTSPAEQQKTQPQQGNLRTIWEAMGLPWLAVVRAVLLASLASASAVSLLAVSAWLITRAWQMPPVLDLSVAVVAVRALGIGRGVLRYLENLASHDVALRGLTRLREQIYRAQVDAATTQLRSGDVLARVGSDIDRLGDTMIKAVLPLVSAGVVGVAAVAASLMLNLRAGLVLAVVLLCVGALTPWWVARRTLACQHDVVDANAQVSAMFHTQVSARHQLRVAGALPQHQDLFDQAQRDWAQAQRRASVPTAWAAALHLIGMLVAVLAALWFGSTAVHAGQLAPQWCAVLCLLPLAAVEVCAPLPTAAGHLAAGQASATRVAALLKDAPRLPALAAPAHAAPIELLSPSGLHANQLSVGWAQQLPGLPANLHLQAAELMVLTGPNGSGKTTLGLTLAGLVPPLSGQVFLDGHPISTAKPPTRSVFFAAADAHVFATSLRENLLLACQHPGTCSDADLLHALDQVGLSAWVHNLPEGLDTPLAAGGVSISGGQRQRLLLARALLTQAHYLILDEPTEHLDAESTCQLWELLATQATQHRQGILVITHALPPGDISVRQHLHVAG